MPPHYEYVHIIIGTVWRFECVEIYKSSSSSSSNGSTKRQRFMYPKHFRCVHCVYSLIRFKIPPWILCRMEWIHQFFVCQLHSTSNHHHRHRGRCCRYSLPLLYAALRINTFTYVDNNSSICKEREKERRRKPISFSSMLCEMRASCARPLVRSLSGQTLWMPVSRRNESFRTKEEESDAAKQKQTFVCMAQSVANNAALRMPAIWRAREKSEQEIAQMHRTTEEHHGFCVFIWTSSSSSIGDGGIVTAAIVWFCMRLSNFVLCSYLCCLSPALPVLYLSTSHAHRFAVVVVVAGVIRLHCLHRNCFK